MSCLGHSGVLLGPRSTKGGADNVFEPLERPQIKDFSLYIIIIAIIVINLSHLSISFWPL